MFIHDKYMQCPFSHVCVQQDCVAVRLTCDECQPVLHLGHRIVTLNNFLTLYKSFIHSEDNVYKNVVAEVEACMRKKNKSFKTSSNWINKSIKFVKKSMEIYHHKVKEIAGALINQEHSKDLFEQFLDTLVLSGHKTIVQELHHHQHKQEEDLQKQVKLDNTVKSIDEYQEIAIDQCDKYFGNDQNDKERLA